MNTRYCALFAALHVAVMAAGPELPAGAVLTQRSAGLFELGAVRLEQPKRRLTFPAELNLDAGTVEYLLVHRTGKTHESVLKTSVDPQQIHLGVLLLGGKPAYTNQFPEGVNAAMPGDVMSLRVRWTDQGVVRERPLEDLVLNKETGRSLSRGPWIYNGSNFAEGAFVAQRDGSIVSVHIDPDALINNPRAGRENDDLHAVNTNTIPRVGVPLEIVMQLGEGK